MLELTGRVVSTVPESSMQKSLHLHPADPVVGEGERLCLGELRAFGDFSWLFEVGPLEQEGFLAEVESGHFRVEVLELCPYHSSKLEFLALKWSMMEHFKEYLTY